MTNQSIRVLVTGKVQGVFFRKAMKTKAEQNGVNGWVRNLRDGRVEAVMEGEDERIDAMVEWCYGGPTNAMVEDVVIQKETYTGQFKSFDIRY